MSKKYLPYLLLVAAACLLYFIKTNQRGSIPGRSATEISIPVIEDDGFNRHLGKIVYSKHARCRMECRHIDESEVLEILEIGTLNRAKIAEDARGKTFPLEGITHDKQHVRVVFAPKQHEVVVVTVIDLEEDWACNCNDP